VPVICSHIQASGKQTPNGRTIKWCSKNLESYIKEKCYCYYRYSLTSFLYLMYFSSMIRTFHTPRRSVSQLEKYNFSWERKNHWPGWCTPIKRMTLLPSRSHFRKQTCDTIPLGRYGLRLTSCGHNSKWAFFLSVTLFF
jgi:hypothetical protein